MSRRRRDAWVLGLTVAGDAAIVLAALATTGYEHSDLRFAIVGLPVAWAVLYAPRSILTSGPVALFAYVATMSRGFTADIWDEHLAIFASAFTGAVALAYVGAREAERAGARVLALEEERRGLLAQALDAEEHERHRLSEAIHDQSLQFLLAAAQDLQELDALPNQAETLAAAKQNLTLGLENLREIVRDMYKMTVLTGSLKTMLTEVGLPLASRGGYALAVDVEPEASGQLDEFVVTLVRELLTNAAKHAHAQAVAVTVAGGRKAGELSVRVRDDGLGLTPERLVAARSEGHIGLAVAQERVRSAGGSWTLTSVPGQGIEVLVTFPLLDRRGL